MTGTADLVMRIVLTVLLFVPLAVGIILKKQNKLDSDKICALIILTGIFLRTLYIYYTKVTVRQHDAGTFFENRGGHSQYILYLLKYHKLPGFDPRTVDQFYHPPLHHIICALWLKLMELLRVGIINAGSETLQALTLGYSSLYCIFAYKSLKRLGLKSRGIVTGTAFVTFHPTLIIMSGSINNDMLSSLFGMISVYLAIKWAQDRKWLSIILLAFSIGFGMMTKLTVGLLAPAVAAVFLTVFIKKISEWKKLVSQFAVFGAICIPIGLFWPVRNYLKFDVPMNFIPHLSERASQYIDIPPLKRLTDFSLHQLSSPFTQWLDVGRVYNEYNPIIALFKNAMFDESTFFRKSITLQSFCTALFFCNIVIRITAVIALVMLWIKNKKVKLEYKLLITFISAVIFGNYIIFCMNFPHVCTENMRYCIPLIFTTAAVCGMLADRDDLKSKFFTKCCAVLPKCTLIFCMLSTFVYTAMAFYYRQK